MPTDYLRLPAGDQRELFKSISNTPGRLEASILEKDVWIVWALDALFTMPNAPEFAFKGGTSLSKIFKIIHRFSEDVDITINPDHPALLAGFNPANPDASKTSLKNQAKQAQERLPGFLQERLLPHLQRTASTLPATLQPEFTVANDKIWVAYQSVLHDDRATAYIPDRVLLEFGVRATTDPGRKEVARTYLEESGLFDGQVYFPTAEVHVLTVERTFWEKATLIHFENTQNRKPSLGKGYARHWYDLSQLAASASIREAALQDAAALRRVLQIKSIYFTGRGVDYAQCGDGRMILTPGDELRQQLEADYKDMREAGMFTGAPPEFTDILESLADLQDSINTHYSANPVTP